MRRLAVSALALLLPTLAMAQSNPTTGFSSGVIHGQRPDMRQDLHNAPGSPTAGGGIASPQAPQTRTQAVRQRSQAAQQQQRRAAQQQRQVARTQRTGSATPAARTPNTVAAQEARLAEARRQQAEAQRRAAEAQDGVALGRQPLGR